MSRLVAGRGIVRGQAEGPAFVSREPISFLGDVDINSGRVVGDLPSVHGRSMRGAVLVFPFSRGSAGAWRFLYQLYKHGNHPLALVCAEIPDPSVVQGAILAGIPIVAEPEEDLVAAVRDGTRLVVDGDQGSVTVG